MNKVVIKGRIQDISVNHEIKGMQYYKANIVVPRDESKSDIITLKYKKDFNKYNVGDEILLEGNLRSFSQQLDDKNKVELYVFTLFPNLEPKVNQFINEVEIDGHICKKTPLRRTNSNKDVIDFVLANNLIIGNKTNNKSLNCYIPTVAWGKWAKEIANYNIGDYISIKGRIQSREYKKVIGDTVEVRVAHELSISDIVKNISTDIFEDLL